MSFTLDTTPPPSAEKRPVETIHHGIAITDNYAWLRADNWQDVMRDPSALPQDIRAYLEAENAYQEAQLADTTDLQDALFEEMKGRVKQDESSVPTPDGPYAYGMRYEEGAEYALFTREPRDGGAETILFDGPKEAQGHEYFALGHMAHSPDHSKIAWSVDTNGSEYHHMRIRDLENGTDREEIIRDVGSAVWTADSQSLVYVEVDQNHRPNKAFHKVPGEEPTLLYEESDPRFYVGVSESLDGRWIVLSTGQNDEDEVRLLPA
ncbi:MAG: S9 family peptidase, partial [Pseudomonadota bacterium]